MTASRDVTPAQNMAGKPQYTIISVWNLFFQLLVESEQRIAE